MKPEFFDLEEGKNVERFKRYGNQVEAELSEATNRLHLRPGHETQPKWISHEDAVTGTRFGKPKNYTRKMNIETVAGTRNWLEQFEIKSSIEPGVGMLFLRVDLMNLIAEFFKLLLRKSDNCRMFQKIIRSSNLAE